MKPNILHEFIPKNITFFNHTFLFVLKLNNFWYPGMTFAVDSDARKSICYIMKGQGYIRSWKEDISEYFNQST